MKNDVLIPLVLITVLLARVACPAQDLKPLDAVLQTAWPQNRAVNLVFHGHSVPAGYHVTPDVRPFESYPHLVHLALKQRYPKAVVNAIVTAIGGESSVPGAERFEREVLVHRPDVVFIDYGLNDRRQTLEETEAAWRSMIRMCKERGIAVVLLTPTGDSRADMTREDDPLRLRAELIRRLAAEEQVLLADVSAAWLAELAAGTKEQELLSQVNHPNLRGHRLAAGVIDRTLRDAGLDP